MEEKWTIRKLENVGLSDRKIAQLRCHRAQFLEPSKGIEKLEETLTGIGLTEEV